MIIDRLTLNRSELIDAPMQHHKLGLQYTRTGYGRKIPMPYKVNYKGKQYRMYCCCFSNIGTCYILQGKDWVVVDAF